MNNTNIETLFKIYPDADPCIQSLERAVDKTLKNTRCWSFWEGFERIYKLKQEIDLLISIKQICEICYQNFTDEEKELYKRHYIDKLSINTLEMTSGEIRAYYRHIVSLLKHASMISDKKGFDDLFYEQYFRQYSFCVKIQKSIMQNRSKNKKKI